MPHFNKYFEPIKPQKVKYYMPKGSSLICEGGGIRGFYTCGVLDGFLKKGLMFPYTIGVSAAAANLLSYISRQIGRNRLLAEHLVPTKEYFSKRNFIKKGSMFGYDFIFNTIPSKYVHLDEETIRETNSELKVGCYDIFEGKTYWYSKEQILNNNKFIIASCSLPFISKAVKIDGHTFFDGGLSEPVPIDKAIEDNNTFHCLISTRNKGYTKPKEKTTALAKIFYPKSKGLHLAMENRHNYYASQMQKMEELEKKDQAYILRPSKPLSVSRLGGSTEEILKLYDDGIEDGEKLANYFIEKFKLKQANS